MYKYSKYNIAGRLSDGSFLIYNLFSSAVAVLDKNEYQSLLDIEQAEMVQNDLLFKAIQNGFLVPKEELENEKIALLRKSDRYNSRKGGFQILPTTHCNARCFYCYEKDFKGESMSDETIGQTIEFIKQFSDGLDQLAITWFGGEPFLAEKTIGRISAELIPLCEEKGIGYYANAISNAALIGKMNLQNIVEKYKISQIQITLDGKGDEHIRRKAYQDPSVSYESILEKIGMLSKNGVKVLVRMNVDRNNVDSILSVIEDLVTIDGDFEKIIPYASPLYSSTMKDICLSEEELPMIFKKIFRKMIDCGFIQTINGLPMNYMNAVCAATGINNYVIAPNGNILKCEHLIDCREEIVGSVRTGIIYNETLSKWNNDEIPEKCRDCLHLPICQGGCAAAEQMGFGYGRCSYVSYIDDAIIDAADYLMKGGERI